MALSSVTYAGDNSTTQFAVTFGYITASDVDVTVDGVSVSFTWDNDAQVNLAAAPEQDAVILIYRSTQNTSRLVDFTAASVLDEASLDKDSNQLFYISQEAKDDLSNALQYDPTTGEYDADSKRIKNLDDGVADNDAINVGQMQPFVDDCETAQAAAELAETNAETAETNAASSASDASDDADATAADLILTDADQQSCAADAASTAQDAIDTAADLVLTDADQQSCAADAVSTASDASDTAQDAIDTAADLVLTDADQVACAASESMAEEWAEKAEDSAITDNPGSYSALHWAAKAEENVNKQDNILINGDFNVWQRGTSFAAAAYQDYTADRFQYIQVGDMVHTVSRDADVPTQLESGHLSNYSLKVDCTTVDAALAAGDACLMDYHVEGYDFAPLVGNTATLSFWVKATKTGIYCVGFSNAGLDRSYVAEYTVNSSDTWEKKTVTVTFDYSGGTWDYTNGIGLFVRFTLASGTDFQGAADTWNSALDFATSNQVNACDSTDNNFLMSQVKLEVGASATQYSSPLYAEELALCQRYYFRMLRYGSSMGFVWNASGDHVYVTITHPTEMRTSPTIDHSTITLIHVLYRTATYALDSLSKVSGDVQTTVLDCVSSTGLAQDAGCGLYLSDSGAWVGFDSEL